jgi:hypothetical protein
VLDPRVLAAGFVLIFLENFHFLCLLFLLFSFFFFHTFFIIEMFLY